MLDDTDGTPATGITAATSGHEIWYQRGFDNAAVTDSGSAADHAAIGDAHTDWEFIHIREGWYRVDFPDAAFLEGVGSVLCGMNATGFTGISETIIIEPLYKFQGQASSVTATTTTFPSGTAPHKGDFIYAVEGTGIRQMVMITSVSGEVATHEVWPDTNISATTTTILLISGQGDAMSDGGINVDALVSDAATPAEVNTQCDTAIADAGLATADKLLGYTQLLARGDAGLATDRATELNEINADEGSGAGTYDNQTDAQEDQKVDVAKVVGKTLATSGTGGFGIGEA
jgi:hypothetical protein